MGGYFGVGYDPRGSLSFGEYQQMSAESISKSVSGAVSSFPGAITGVVAGATIGSILSPGFGTLVGGAVGLTADMAIGLLGGKARERNTFAEGIQNFTEPIFGGMSRSQSREIADDLQARTRSYSGQLEGIGMNDIQEIMATFGNAGGYSGTTNPQEFQQRTKDVLDNVRATAHALNTFQEEAAQIMGELQQRGIHGAAGMGGFAAGQQAMGASMGMTGTQFIQAGLGGAQMVQGSRMGAGTGFNMMQEAMVTMGSLQSDPFGASLVADMGGINAGAASMMETAIRATQGPRGIIQSANFLAGGSYLEGDTTNQLMGASSYFSADPANYLRFMGAQNQITGAAAEAYGVDGMNAQILGSGISDLRRLGYKGPIDSFTLMGLMKQTRDMDPNNTEAMIRAIKNPDAQNTRDMNFMTQLDQMQRENTTGL